MTKDTTNSPNVRITRTGAPQRKDRFRFALIGLAVFAVGLVLVIFLWPADTVSPEFPTPPSPRPQKQRGEKPREKLPPQLIRQTKAAESVTSTPAVETYLGQPVVSHSYTTNATGRSVREIIVTADGKRHGRTTVIAKPTFKYSTDQLLADVLFPPRTGVMPPLPAMDAKSLDKEFAQSLLDPIVIGDDDTEEVRMKKRAVAGAREEIAKLVEEGQSVLSIIERERAANEDERAMQLEVRKGLHELRKQGATQEQLADYLSRANEELEQVGIAPVAEPDTWRSRE